VGPEVCSSVFAVLIVLILLLLCCNVEIRAHGKGGGLCARLGGQQHEAQAAWVIHVQNLVLYLVLQRFDAL